MEWLRVAPEELVWMTLVHRRETLGCHPVVCACVLEGIEGRYKGPRQTLALDLSLSLSLRAECSKYEQERESLMDVVHEQCGENKWNARCVEEDSGMRYLVGLDEECNITVVDAMKDFLGHAWNKRQGC
ncbi:hypothetical protein FHG87_025868 [Trinorchestia longiramus]|nr:hypothetical protein FHG87_025868 [Trinorchestia longiramus]